jgi:hypothetical protein
MSPGFAQIALSRGFGESAIRSSPGSCFEFHRIQRRLGTANTMAIGILNFSFIFLFSFFFSNA